MIYCQQCGAATEELVRDGRVRPVCTGCGAVTYLDPKLAAAVLIVRDGRVLLGLRGEGARAAGKWSFPAGFVERGETVEAAAIRETKEEVGGDVQLGRLLGLFSSPGETVVLAVYQAAVGDTPLAAGDDLVELGWFGPDALPELAFPHDLEIISRWIESSE